MGKVSVLYSVLFSVCLCACLRGETAGKPECIRKIDLRDFGGMIARFGDLNGDGKAEAVFIQVAKKSISCVTAIDLDGRVLWQRGTPDLNNRRIQSDIAAQVYDVDGDGKDEVLVVEKKTLRILDGLTGKVTREATAPANDSLLIADFSGEGHPGDLVLKDRYKHIWVYDKQLRLRWTADLNTGHFPMNIDIDGDGRDELLCGYTLFAHDGRVRWSHPELPEHADAVDADDMDGDGIPEIAIACSKDSVLLNADGRILWRKQHRHSQHALIGAFVAGKRGKQVVFVDRVDAHALKGGIVYCYDISGTELWHTAGQGGLTIASTIDGWTGDEHRSFVLLSRRAYGPPVLLDGRGHVVAEFPFPPAAPRGRRHRRFGQYFTQHFDAFGDAREEVFVYNTDALWIYHNAAPAPPDMPAPKRAPDPRIYNASFYVGRQ